MTDSGQCTSGNDRSGRHDGAPDRFAMCSGGMDSVAMTHYMMQQWEDEKKRPVVVYLDTTIGLSSQRLYVELLCDHYGWQLWKLRTHENFDEHSKEEGFYGNQQHDKIFNRIKGRQIDKLTTVSGNPHIYFGSRVDEKGEHVQPESWNESYGAWTHNPIHDWSNEDVVEYLRENEVPFNPNWEAAHFTDCGCGATASREELIELEAEGYEVFAEKLRELEKDVQTGDRREVWAWGSFEPDKQQWLDADRDDDQMQLSDIVCGLGCSGKSKLAKTDGGGGNRNV